MRVKVRIAPEQTWISALPESLKHEFSLEELEQMKKQFADFDTSGDGSIAASELIALMNSMGIETTIDEVQELIDKVDDNHSGELEYVEFVRLISEFRRGNGEKLATFIQYSKLALEIRQELLDLEAHPTRLSTASAMKGNAWEWRIRIRGPPESPYEGGIFHFHVRFGHDYPYEAPVLSCLTRIYHPNFVPLLNGSMSLYGLMGSWEPEWRVRTLIERVEVLLATPDVDLMSAFYDETVQLQALAARTHAANGSPKKSLRQPRDMAMECIDNFLTDSERFAQIARELTAALATLLKRGLESVECFSRKCGTSVDGRSRAKPSSSLSWRPPFWFCTQSSSSSSGSDELSVSVSVDPVELFRSTVSVVERVLVLARSSFRQQNSSRAASSS
ncbi:hypothetical protein Gpo141_00007826 [Globisporangium polare]